MTEFRFFGDASGDKASPVLVAGGFVSSVEKWAAFESAWRSLLRKHKVHEPFHMTEFVGGQGHFREFRGRSDLRHRFYLDVLALLRWYTHKPFGYGVVAAEHEEAARAAADAAIFGKHCPPYSWCALAVCFDVFRWGMRRKRGTDQLGIVFEEGDAGRGVLLSVMQEAFTTKNPVGTCTKDQPQAQAADFLCWILARILKAPDVRPDEAEVRLVHELRRKLPCDDLVKMDHKRTLETIDRIKARGKAVAS